MHPHSERNYCSVLACESAQHAWQECLHPHIGQNCHSSPACELAHHAYHVGLWGSGPLGYLQPAYDPQTDCHRRSELTLPHRIARPTATTVAVVVLSHQSDIQLCLGNTQADSIAV